MIATHDDLDRIVEMGRQFHAYSPWSDVPYDPETVRIFAANTIDKGVIFLSFEGMCGGIIHPLYFSPETLIGIEFFWWRGSGLRQLFEDWCRERGAFGVQFSALADDHLPAVSRLYRAAGFKAAETAFVKRF